MHCLKPIFTFLCISMLAPSFAQTDTAITYSGVVQVEGKTAAQLYDMALMWYNDAFKSGKDVLQITDKEGGKLMGKAVFTHTIELIGALNTTEGKVTYSVKIFVKDGRYKYEISDFISESLDNQKFAGFGRITSSNSAPDVYLFGFGQGVKNRHWMEIRRMCDDKALQLIVNLKKYMTEHSTSDSDW